MFLVNLGHFNYFDDYIWTIVKAKEISNVCTFEGGVEG